MNLSRARRRWRAWDRYLSYLSRLDQGTACPPGAWTAYERLLDHRYSRRERLVRRDARLVVARVLAALDDSRAAA